MSDRLGTLGGGDGHSELMEEYSILDFDYDYKIVPRERRDLVGYMRPFGGVLTWVGVMTMVCSSVMAYYLFRKNRRRDVDNKAIRSKKAQVIKMVQKQAVKGLKKKGVDMVLPASLPLENPYKFSRPLDLDLTPYPNPLKITPSGIKIDEIGWWVEIARSQLDLKNYPTAAYYAQRVLQDLPPTSNTLTRAYMLFIITIEKETSKTILLPQLILEYQCVGKILAEVGKNERLVSDNQLFAEYLRLSSEVHTKIGDCYSTEKDYAKAIERYEMAMAELERMKIPNYLMESVLLFKLSFTYGNMKEYDRAIEKALETYKMAIDENLGASFASKLAIYLSSLYLKKNDDDLAISSLKSHVERFEGLKDDELISSTTHDEQIVPANKALQCERARKQLDFLLAPCHLYLSNIHHNLQNLEEALIHIRRAAKLLSKSEILISQVAQLFELHEDDEAIKIVGRILLARIDLKMVSRLFTSDFYMISRHADGGERHHVYYLKLVFNNDIHDDEQTIIRPGNLLEIRPRLLGKLESADFLVPSFSSPPPLAPPKCILVEDTESHELVIRGRMLCIDAANCFYELVIHVFQDETKQNCIGIHRQPIPVYEHTKSALLKSHLSSTADPTDHQENEPLPDHLTPDTDQILDQGVDLSLFSNYEKEFSQFTATPIHFQKLDFFNNTVIDDKNAETLQDDQNKNLLYGVHSIRKASQNPNNAIRNLVY